MQNNEAENGKITDQRQREINPLTRVNHPKGL